VSHVGVEATQYIPGAGHGYQSNVMHFLGFIPEPWITKLDDIIISKDFFDNRKRNECHSSV
jgi:hypothetical protein